MSEFGFASPPGFMPARNVRAKLMTYRVSAHVEECASKSRLVPFIVGSPEISTLFDARFVLVPIFGNHQFPPPERTHQCRHEYESYDQRIDRNRQGESESNLFVL